MTDADDPIDPFQTDALLDDPSSSGAGALAAVLQDLAAPGLPHEMVGEAAAVAQMQAALTATAGAPTPGMGRRFTKPIVALAAAGSLAFGGVAAAAVVDVPVVSDIVEETGEKLADAADAVVEFIGIDSEPSDEKPEPNVPGAETDGIEPGEPGPDVDTDDDLDEPGNSGRAQTDCGKKDAEPTGDPECDDADNHGDFVNEGNNGGGNGEGNNGNGNGNGGGDGSNGGGNGEGNNGNGNGNGGGDGSNGGGNGNGSTDGASGTEGDTGAAEAGNGSSGNGNNGNANNGNANGNGVATNNGNGNGVDGNNGNGNGNLPTDDGNGNNGNNANGGNGNNSGGNGNS